MGYKLQRRRSTEVNQTLHDVRPSRGLVHYTGRHVFGRAAITLGIGPHSSFPLWYFFNENERVLDKQRKNYRRWTYTAKYLLRFESGRAFSWSFVNFIRFEARHFSSILSNRTNYDINILNYDINVHTSCVYTLTSNHSLTSCSEVSLCMLHYTWRKKVPPLQLAIIFTCTVRLRQFLA